MYIYPLDGQRGQRGARGQVLRQLSLRAEGLEPEEQRVRGHRERRQERLGRGLGRRLRLRLEGVPLRPGPSEPPGSVASVGRPAHPCGESGPAGSERAAWRAEELAGMERGGLKKGSMKFQRPSVQNEYGNMEKQPGSQWLRGRAVNKFHGYVSEPYDE